MKGYMSKIQCISKCCLNSVLSIECKPTFHRHLVLTLLSIRHGHNDGLTHPTGWNGVQVSQLDSICNYGNDLLTP